MGAITSQSRESRDQEREKLVKIRFLNTNKVNGMRRNKVYKFSSPGSETSSIPLKNTEEVRGERKKQEVKRNGQEHEVVVRVQREKIRSGWKKDRRFEGEGEMGVLH